ncbi:MAG: ATP-binding protein, partial [Chloroflexota bacterium]
GVALSVDRAIITADLALHPQASPRLELALAQEGFRSEMVLPLRIADHRFGTLNFISKRSDTYQADDLRIGLVLALQLSTALEAARLYAQIDEERSMLVAILQSTTDGVLVVNSALNVAVANPPVAELLGIDLDSLLGAELAAVVTNAKLIELFEQVLQGSAVRDAELSLSEDRTFHLNITPVTSNFGEVLGYVAVFHDVTTLKSLDQMKTDFVATVSHDLKNPISIIKLSAAVLSKSAPLNAKQAETLDRIERASDRMLSLINDLLDLGRIEAGMGLLSLPCDLKQIAQEVIDEQNSLVEAKHLAFEFVAPDVLPAVNGDAPRLKQVIANFVSNAIKYTPDNGQVTLALQHVNASVELTITDSGYGIAAKDLPYIFDKFYRVYAEHTKQIEGTGLGLAITRSIIEQHRGQVWVTSQLGQGSTFGFRLAVPSSDSASLPEIKSTQAERHIA